MTGPEIAARAGLTPDSVRVNLHRGMKLLRERLSASRLPYKNTAAEESR
jgi:RNA polymerase sigma-70 factor (ECF subfamily)